MSEVVLRLSKDTLTTAYACLDAKDQEGVSAAVVQDAQEDILAATRDLPAHDTHAEVELKEPAWLLVYGAVYTTDRLPETTAADIGEAEAELWEGLPPMVKNVAESAKTNGPWGDDAP